MDASLYVGTTLLIVTPEDAKNIHSQIKGAKAKGDGTYYIPCKLKGKAPPLKLKINNHHISVSSEDYILIANDSDKSMCVSGISGQEIHRPNHWILGSVFLKSHYTVSFLENYITQARFKLTFYSKQGV